MLVKRSLVWVALLFLGTTVFLFWHLQAIEEKTGKVDITNTNSVEMETSNVVAENGVLSQETNISIDIEKIEQEQDSSSTHVSEQIDSKQQNTATRQFNDVHVFYYPWYANLETDGKWSHWDHHILPHWDAVTKAKYKHGIQYIPPDDVGANFFPERGPYSSADPKLIDSHMAELSGYVVVISWWGKIGADGEGSPTNALVPAILKSAEKYNAKIAIHLEPYEGRDAQSVKHDIEYIYANYGSSPALYRDPNRNNRIVIYVYDSYHTPANQWATIFSKSGSSSIRGTPHDVVAIGLYLTRSDKTFLVDSHFDGFYTYFAADGFTEGSTYRNWNEIGKWAKDNNLIFSLSLGPGYDDTRIRPWNFANKRDRENGTYYDTQWNAAFSALPEIISITSYNEWHEGTQIEAAIPKTITKTIFSETEYSYVDYSPLEPNYYMTKTHEWAQKFMDSKTLK